MATRALHLHSLKRNITYLLFLSLLFFSLLIALHLFRSSSISPSLPSQPLPFFTTSPEPNLNPNYRPCNFSDGSWFYDAAAEIPPRYDHTCKEIFKGWNCIAGNKSNALDITRWRWKPNGCELLQFDSLQFLQSYRNRNIGFVGDSLNRNMFVSLFCTLKRVSSKVEKWRPAGADRGFTFIQYNVTIAYHRTNLLARYGRWSPSASGGVLESLGYKDGYRVDVDVPDGTWANAVHFHDIIVFNTGHWWWAPSKFDPIKSPMLFFEKGLPLMPQVHPDVGLDIVLKNMISYVERNSRPGSIKVFRTQSPRHFEGGDWNEGGSCNRQAPLTAQLVEQLFSLRNKGTNVEARYVNQHLYKAIEGTSFHMLDITHISEFRADAHPSSAGGKKHDDCMHWCLPGLTDTWNDMLIAHLNRIAVRN